MKSTAMRFADKVQVGPECWEWTACKDREGYGGLKVSGEKILAHRYSYSLFSGKIPDGKLVCHTCDNPSCVNPAHLFLGANKDNVRDMVAKGRHSGQKKTHCVSGHQLAGDNLYIRANGGRACRKCRAEATRRWRARQ